MTGNWSPYPNLFAAGGSVQDYSSATPTYAYFVKATHSKSLAFISYGPSIPSSYDACNTAATGLKAAGVNVSFVDVGAQLGGSFTSDVQRLQQSGSDALISCMQASDNVTLSRDIQQYGLSIKQLWLNGYDQNLLNQYSSVMQGVYMSNAGNVPFAAAAYPTIYPGMAAYTAAMNKYEPQYTTSNVALAGWQSAALHGRGDQGGREATSPRPSVISATNKITTDTAGQTQAPTNWTVAHVKATSPACTAWVQVKGSSFVTVFATGKQVFVCLEPQRQEPGAGDAAGRHTGGMSQAVVGQGLRGDRTVEHFLGFALPGIPYGCTYALVAVGLVLTYQATGVLNFAYGAQAYLSAFVFT